MSKEYFPFTPGVPVPPELFVGRQEEIEEIVHRVGQSARGKRIQTLFVIGERGIGKSSLCRFAAQVVEARFRVLPIHVYLGGISSLEGMARRIFDRLLRESQAQSWFERIKRFLGNHVKEVGLYGISVKFDASEDELSSAVDNFVPAMRNLVRTLESDRHGVLLIMDDINGLTRQSRFANWFKSVVDEAATGREGIALTIVLVGLPQRRFELIQCQPSLARVFDLIDIKTFNMQETQEFFQKAFASVGVEVAEQAHKILWRFSGGFPMFMHEIGAVTYNHDDDDYISPNDALQGVLKAAEIIGEKYIEPTVMKAVRSVKYRQILHRIVKDNPTRTFQRQDILRKLPEEQKKVFDNFIRRMIQLGVVRIREEAGPGHYEFTSELYTLFFWIQAAAERKSTGRKHKKEN